MELFPLAFWLGKGRHLPYTKRGKKRLTITNILKRLREKKIAAIVALYLVLDYLQDGMIDGSLLLTVASYL